MKHPSHSLQKSAKRFDLNRSKRRTTTKLISRIAFILFIIGIFLEFKVFNVSLIVIAIILWILSSTIAGILYPRNYAPSNYAPDPSIVSQVQDKMGYCEVCGTPLTKGAAFCTECGAMINHPPST